MASPRLLKFLTHTVIGILLFLPANSVDGFPNGVGEIGNEGCLCHGNSNPNTEIALSGLPEKFASNTSYALTLKLSNDVIMSTNESAQGGFRIVLEGGTLLFENNTGQLIDDGWTHSESSNQQRIWNLTWLSPNDNTTMTKFIIYGNAVNGNQLSSGDNWYVAESYVPGEQNFDPIPNSLTVEHELEVFDKTMLILGLLTLVYICFRIARN